MQRSRDSDPDAVTTIDQEYEMYLCIAFPFGAPQTTVDEVAETHD